MVPCSFQEGGLDPEGMVLPLPGNQNAGSTHPTGMFFLCSLIIFLFIFIAFAWCELTLSLRYILLTFLSSVSLNRKPFSNLAMLFLWSLLYDLFHTVICVLKLQSTFVHQQKHFVRKVNNTNRVSRVILSSVIPHYINDIII